MQMQYQRWLNALARRTFSAFAVVFLGATLLGTDVNSHSGVACEGIQNDGGLAGPCRDEDWQEGNTLMQSSGKETPMQPAAQTLPLRTPDSRHSYQNIPHQVLFRTDAFGNPDVAGNLSNIRQGRAGDCYFLASLMAVARGFPEVIRTLVHDHGDGTYSARFYGLQSASFWAAKHRRGSFTARVNGDLPSIDGKPVYNWVENDGSVSISWASIIEKLWAAVNHNDYARIDGYGDSGQDDHDIQNGLFALTGVMPVERRIDRLTVDQVVYDLRHGAVVVGTSPRVGNVTADHAFAVLDVDPAAGLVFLGDPEGPRPAVDFATFTLTNINQYFFVPIHAALVHK